LLKLSATRRLLPIIPNRNLYNNGGIFLGLLQIYTRALGLVHGRCFLVNQQLEEEESLFETIV
jgi:hypothetical protein